MAKHFYTRRSEPDMRSEFNRTMDGFFPEIAKGQIAVLRKMRRDSSNNLVACPCVDPLTREPDKDTFCPICHSEGYLWDETFIDTYKVVIKSDVGNAQKEAFFGPGIMNVPIVSFFTKSSISVTTKDKIVELLRDEEGEPIKPYSRIHVYNITSAIDLRADNGRLEYYKLTCYSEKRKFLNGPTG